MKIEWRTIKGFEGRYYINQKGEIKNYRDYILKQKLDKDGYYQVTLCKYINDSKVVRTSYVHKLVAEAFVPNPKNYKYILKKDGNKLNNNATNLIWTEHNNKSKSRAYLSGRSRKGARCVKNLDTGSEHDSISSAARLYNISVGGIYNCCTGRNKTSGGYRWAFIDDITEEKQAIA